MRRSCENCGQPALDTDTICWHCGQALTPKEVAPAPKPTKRNVVAIPEPTSPEPLPMVAITVYGTITAVLIVSMLLVMHSLGQRPLVMFNPETGMNREWVPITAYDQRFTLDLPLGWAWLQNDQDAFATLIAEGEVFETAVYPLGTIAKDMDYLLVAMPQDVTPSGTGFILITRSHRLGPLTPAQSIALVEQSSANFNLVEADKAVSFTGLPLAEFMLELPVTEDGILRCRQYFMPDTDAAYLLAGCAPQPEFSNFVGTFDRVLTSFQPLRSSS